MEVVRFKNGMYGVRRSRFWFDYEFLDMREDKQSNWWAQHENVVKYCQGTLEDAKTYCIGAIDKGTPVKI